MTVVSWQMQVQMFLQIAHRCAKIWINCRWQSQGQVLDQTNKLLFESYDRQEICRLSGLNG